MKHAAGEPGGRHTQGLHFNPPRGPSPAQRDSLAFDGSYWSITISQLSVRTVVPPVPNISPATNPAQVTSAPAELKDPGNMSFYKNKLQAVIWELRGMIHILSVMIPAPA